MPGSTLKDEIEHTIKHLEFLRRNFETNGLLKNEELDDLEIGIGVLIMAKLRRDAAFEQGNLL